ncbi:ornithine decarboxylase [Caulochytrium protostelioides]|uniref:ornithine decarboxylase n=1 Tax=Caulochytrium protostelioides TaxID=1555241 RepID=A0A4P9X1N0_9FUNG|nr:ornithine decarboxylase [Caulochytrium protostelioides]
MLESGPVVAWPLRGLPREQVILEPAKRRQSTSLEKAPLNVFPTVDSRNAHTRANSAVQDDGEAAFFVADMGHVVRQHERWHAALPRIEPFYAMKCNPDPIVVKTLVDCGSGLDCASKTELQLALAMGAHPSKIIFANPCKMISHIAFAVEHGIRMMTFDNLEELEKIHQVAPNARLVLRILTDDTGSACKLSLKFGASMAAVPKLLARAVALGLEIIGVSFHVGSGCSDPTAFVHALNNAARVFEMAPSYGFHMTLLDIGGGFPGHLDNKQQFDAITELVGPQVDALFGPEIRVISEPGRYFVAGAFTLAVNVVARRSVLQDVDTTAQHDAPPSDPAQTYMYYVNDGVYGSFNNIMFDHYVPEARVLKLGGRWLFGHAADHLEAPRYESSLWGPTCDSIDCLSASTALPEMQIGDWLYFENMGAYTCAAASCFNGFVKSRIWYTFTQPALGL